MRKIALIGLTLAIVVGLATPPLWGGSAGGGGNGNQDWSDGGYYEDYKGYGLWVLKIDPLPALIIIDIDLDDYDCE